MVSRSLFDRDVNQVLFEGKSRLRKIILNRPQKLNSLTHEMISQVKRVLEEFEVDDEVKLVILTGNGKAFSAGGDVVRVIQSILTGHWSYAASFYRKQLMLDYIIATYQKPLVLLINGIVMGGGAGLSMNGMFRVVTENTVFAMPEVSIGLYPDVGACYFLSRLPAHFGEYLGLTGARINGIEMLECGLATHFVLSKDLRSLENELHEVVTVDESTILNVVQRFKRHPSLKHDSACRRLEVIDKCFSKKTVEDILSSLENEVVSCGEKWIISAINSIKSASPRSLKVFLFSIREGRALTLEECLIRDYNVCRHMARRTFNSDFFEGARAIFFDKDKEPKWEPQKLEEVNEIMIKEYFTNVADDDDWDFLKLPQRNVKKRVANSRL